MPHITEESDKDTSRRAGSSINIVLWWNKFHFSGRVIMCSVLFGLGLILIGGLIFAINMDDDSSKSENLSELPTKAPSKYVGPSIMGIGGFIVIVGVIMCLFETQVCRKKSSDFSPLISGKADPEEKGSDSIPVPSSSHSHKNHKHGVRKISTSPRKSKSKHSKSHSKEKGQQKSPSPTSPPVSIEKSKSFMTSSEDKFLTPPNVLDTSLEHSNSNIIENQPSPSLMKSFTSSGPSWNQSSEFLTPSASFKDASISMNSSVEVNEKQQQVNFKTTDFEYMTPLTVEEDRIQKLLIRVRNEQKEMVKRETEEKISEINVSTRSENDVAHSSGIQTTTVKEDTKMSKNIENKDISTDSLPAAPLEHVSSLNNISPPQRAKLENIDELSENKKIFEETAISDKDYISNIHTESPVENNEYEIEVLHMDNDINEKKYSGQDREKQKASSVSGTSVSLDNENNPDRDHILNKEITDDEANENDLENSVSSVETVVAPDSFMKKSETKENGESTLKENLSNHSKARNDSESLCEAISAADNSNSEPPNIPLGVTKGAEVESVVFSHTERDTKVDKYS